MAQTPSDAIEIEFTTYYNADELPPVQTLAVDEYAPRSAERLRELVGDEGAPETAALLREMAEDRGHPVVMLIGTRSLYDWNGDEESWQTFRRLVGRIADELER